MEALRVVINIIFILVCVALTVLVPFMQQGKLAGLGSISGAAETYWGQK